MVRQGGIKEQPREWPVKRCLERPVETVLLDHPKIHIRWLSEPAMSWRRASQNCGHSPSRSGTHSMTNTLMCNCRRRASHGKSHLCSSPRLLTMNVSGSVHKSKRPNRIFQTRPSQVLARPIGEIDAFFSSRSRCLLCFHTAGVSRSFVAKHVGLLEGTSLVRQFSRTILNKEH